MQHNSQISQQTNPLTLEEKKKLVATYQRRLLELSSKLGKEASDRMLMQLDIVLEVGKIGINCAETDEQLDEQLQHLEEANDIFTLNCAALGVE